MFATINWWGVILGALSAMVIGVIWYSPFLFGKQWTKAMGVSEKEMNSGRAKAMPILVLGSLLTAYALSLVTIYLQNFQDSGFVKAGFEAGLLAAAGFAGTALVVHGVFDPRSKKTLYINLGNRLVTLAMMGLIVGAFQS
jgi:hypothetical protein